MNGKGMRPRLGYNQKLYEENYDRIFRRETVNTPILGHAAFYPARPIPKLRPVRRGRTRKTEDQEAGAKPANKGNRMGAGKHKAVPHRAGKQNKRVGD